MALRANKDLYLKDKITGEFRLAEPSEIMEFMGIPLIFGSTLRHNLILKTDSYKFSHWEQYPDGTWFVYSYIESRGGAFDKNVMFAMEMYRQDILSKKVTMEDVDQAEEFVKAHGLPFNRAGWELLVTRHGGNLPIRIKAVPDGTVVNGKNILVSIENTDPDFFWLTSYLETVLLSYIWYGTTVCTLSWSIKLLLAKFHQKSSDSPLDAINFKLHDFGYRGVSSEQSAMIGAAAHLTNFYGTDTVAGLVAARDYYGEFMAGFSIPAAEHSTMTALGRDGEAKQFERMVDKYSKPGALYAVVSDGYDIYNAADKIWGEMLKNKVVASGGKLIVRPDSGEPTEVPLEVINILMQKYYFTTNSKDYHKLPEFLGVIQGDGINYDSIQCILMELEDQKLSLDNMAFGMGGGLLQQINRDTLKFAMKASAMNINGEWVDIFKDPVTDPGKKSKTGRMKLVKENGIYKTVRIEEPGEDQMVLIYENGQHYNRTNFAEVRARAHAGLLEALNA